MPTKCATILLNNLVLWLITVIESMTEETITWRGWKCVVVDEWDFFTWHVHLRRATCRIDMAAIVVAQLLNNNHVITRYWRSIDVVSRATTVHIRSMHRLGVETWKNEVRSVPMPRNENRGYLVQSSESLFRGIRPLPVVAWRRLNALNSTVGTPKNCSVTSLSHFS